MGIFFQTENENVIFKHFWLRFTKKLNTFVEMFFADLVSRKNVTNIFYTRSLNVVLLSNITFKINN